MSRTVQAQEMSGSRRRIATGVLAEVAVPEGEALRPLARALIDLALSLVAENDEEETA